MCTITTLGKAFRIIFYYFTDMLDLYIFVVLTISAIFSFLKNVKELFYTSEFELIVI